MSKYMLLFSYTGQAVPGLLKDGGSKREVAARQLVESLGGTMEAFYYAFGEFDGVAIADMPGNAEMAAASLTLAASGAVTCRTVVLLTPAELDAAAQRTASYRPPGA